MPTPKKPNPRSTGKIKPGSGINKPLPGDKYPRESSKKAAAFGTMPKMTAAEAKKADANKKKAISEYSKKNPVKGTIAEMKRTGDKNVKAIKKSVKSGMKELSSQKDIQKVFGYNTTKKK
jgi:hypothetical protein